MTKIIKLSPFSYQNLLGVLLVILFLPSLSFAKDESLPSKNHAQSEGSKTKRELHWDYLGVEGPLHWGLLSEEYVTCEMGSKQSPVNIVTKGMKLQQETLKFNYRTSEIHEMNNGHTIQVSHKSGCNINLDKNTYHLRQFHFHDPSEHHIDGKAYPMEMHLVHQDDSGRILVVAVMMEIGNEHPIMQKILNWLPSQQGKEASVPITGNIRDVLPKDTLHYTYSGSLTTPPCTEGVKWLVLTKPIQISEESVKKFASIIGSNARPVQPLGNRHIDLK